MAVDCLADRVFRYAELHGHVPYIGLRGHITHPYGFNLFGVEFSTIVTNFPGDWRNQRAAAVGQSTNDVAHRSLGDTVFRSQREELLSRVCELSKRQPRLVVCPNHLISRPHLCRDR